MNKLHDHLNDRRRRLFVEYIYVYARVFTMMVANVFVLTSCLHLDEETDQATQNNTQSSSSDSHGNEDQLDAVIGDAPELAILHDSSVSDESNGTNDIPIVAMHACGAAALFACPQHECLCGMCTEQCNDNAQCKELMGLAQALCLETTDPIFFDMCTIGPVQGRVCAVPCTMDEDCPMEDALCIFPRTIPPTYAGFCMTGRTSTIGVDLERPREIIHRSCSTQWCPTCDEKKLDSNYTLNPTLSCTPLYGGCSSSIKCVNSDDCQDAPFGWCYSFGNGFCRYPDNELQPCEIDEECDIPLPGACAPTTAGKKCRVLSGGECEIDADCTQSKGGVCERQISQTWCEYDECRSDTDCGLNGRCICTGRILECMVAECDTDEDCSPNSRCQVSQPAWPGDTVGFHCSTPLDTCTEASECVCGYVNDPEPHFECIEPWTTP